MRFMKSIFLIAAFLIVLDSCSKKSAPTTTTPAEKKETVVIKPTVPAINAVDVYSNKCARCHGPNGYDGKAPNLAMARNTKEETADIIANGHGKMPSFSDKLSKEEIASVATFVFGMQK
jgi:cytochrome c553